MLQIIIIIIIITTIIVIMVYYFRFRRSCYLNIDSLYVKVTGENFNNSHAHYVGNCQFNINVLYIVRGCFYDLRVYQVLHGLDPLVH
jgi:flagellar basal body-associated protein FliL